MKSFFKTLLASTIGVLIAPFVFLFLLLIVSLFIGIFSSGDKVKLDNNSVLRLSLNHEIPEKTSDNPFESFDFNTFKAKATPPGLNDILKAINHAKEDERIKGIYLELSYIPSGISKISAIRDALKSFKSSNKFIICYGEFFSQSAYYLASVADHIYLNPAGIIEFKGLSSERTFFKGALKKIGVEPQIIRYGKFKSAVEPFIYDKMSEENKIQTAQLLSTVWGHIIADVAEGRKLSVNNLNAFVDTMPVQTPFKALSFNMVDSLLYQDEVENLIKVKLGLTEKEEQKKVKYVKVSKYCAAIKNDNKKLGSDEIAVIYAEGSISSGKGNNESIGSESLSEEIKKARLDKKVKAIVFRVNSPGGSALASEVIWREVYLAKQVKPVVVSMGDYAASGGYYISCAANTIVAEPTTVTGSIGVFGIIPNCEELFTEKLGLSFDKVTTNKMSDFGATYRPMNVAEIYIMQNMIDTIYDDFITRVSEGRNMNKNKVDEVGQGRVWTGKDALEIGLVDTLGGIQTAVNIAAKMAKIESYTIVELPRHKEAFEKILSEFDENVRSYFVKKELGIYYEPYQSIKSASNLKGVQALLPYKIMAN